MFGMSGWINTCQYSDNQSPEGESRPNFWNVVDTEETC